MTIVVSVLLLLLLLVAAFLLSLRKALLGDEPAVRLEVMRLDGGPGLRLRVAVDDAPVTIRSISVGRALAEALRLEPPRGFRRVRSAVPVRETFEADLEELIDARGPTPAVAEIESEERRQFQEAVQIAEWLDREAVQFKGRLRVATSADLVFPGAQAAADAHGTIWVVFSQRVGILRRHASARAMVPRAAGA